MDSGDGLGMAWKGAGGIRLGQGGGKEQGETTGTWGVFWRAMWKLPGISEGDSSMNFK